LRRTKRFIKRWEVVRKVNEIRHIEHHQFEKKQHFNDAWIRFFHLRHVLKNLAEKYNVVRNEEIRKIRSDWCIRRITKQVRKFLIPRAPTLEYRLHNTASCGLTLMQILVKDIVKDRTKPVLYDFLDQTAK
jgi:hypothetical protein